MVGMGIRSMVTIGKGIRDVSIRGMGMMGIDYVNYVRFKVN